MASRAPSAIFSCPPCNAYGLACESTDCVLFRVFLDSNNECFQTLMKFYKKPQLVIMLNTLLRIGDVIGDSKFALEWAELLAIQIRAIKQLNIQSGNALNRINAIEMAIEQLNIQSGNALNRLNAIEINFDAFRNVQGARNINLIESDDPQRRFMAQFGQRMAIEIDDYNFFAARQSSLNLILLQILAQLNGHVYILFF
ncbi:uncharacterized protein LOC107873169 isoform X1 [Capsicum annuum]|uniref:uncharacterized protein LOC107873169 isoform X1 n=1 Tax=Capsicum annuum TaxID=4072 RepID=UPI0007BF08DE|nr:uncharacterized protein LOC107873169 isoform X1 [Capsicum annuum]